MVDTNYPHIMGPSVRSLRGRKITIAAKKASCIKVSLKNRSWSRILRRAQLADIYLTHNAWSFPIFNNGLRWLAILMYRGVPSEFAMKPAIALGYDMVRLNYIVSWTVPQAPVRLIKVYSPTLWIVSWMSHSPWSQQHLTKPALYVFFQMILYSNYHIFQCYCTIGYNWPLRNTRNHDWPMWVVAIIPQQPWRLLWWELAWAVAVQHASVARPGPDSVDESLRQVVVGKWQLDLKKLGQEVPGSDEVFAPCVYLRLEIVHLELLMVFIYDAWVMTSSFEIPIF